MKIVFVTMLALILVTELRAFLNLNVKVIAIELQKPCQRYLSRRFVDKIVLIGCALGAEDKTEKMYLSSNSAISSLSADWIESLKSNRFKDHQWNDSMDVKVTTLDSLINKYGFADFVKIDVEGYEYEVLKGFTGSFSVMSFEYTVPERTDQLKLCINYLKSLSKNLKFNYSYGEELELISNEWLSVNELLQLSETD